MSLDNQLERLCFYNPINFIRGKELQLAELTANCLSLDVEVGKISVQGEVPRLYVRYLDWDSDYFDIPTYRLEFVAWETVNITAQEIASSITQLISELHERHDSYYLFMESPSEDLLVLSALSIAGLRLIETRLTYFRDDLNTYEYNKRFAVRLAVDSDIPALRDVAGRARNRFDRFHADPFFLTEVADSFLSTFVENSVKGFADVVIVPDVINDLPGAFLTGMVEQRYKDILQQLIGRMVLSAVGPERRGWYLRLISELSYWYKDKGISTVYMATQSTNRAVIRVWETLGYRFGRCSHVFALGNPDNRNINNLVGINKSESI